MSVTGSRHLGTSASKTFIGGRAIAIAFGRLGGSLTLCVACETTVKPALTI
jgi:hypothetical protein